ncbi:MAG: alcohol dehydrogenase catalytic domain-containing protein [Pyrinomonadaceae bacterium]|nr:alcohol dehydrogenase catalytic domain-containing protein [Pyrinomonadaceae bacterium]MBP6212409.1 alcohol dehydrogenase catalytic domain-containing protein [Pyrinomonadaceae bacterium]
MKALRFTGGRLSLDDIPPPAAHGEALVRVTRSGICNTDIEIVRGYAGFEGTIGHEFVGVVESAVNRPELIGKRVVGEINAGCGTCEKCLAGDPRHCPTRTVLGIVGRDGAHAEYLTLPTVNLIEVPDRVTDEQAVFAEPLAAAYGIAEQVDIEPDTKVAVIGDGKLGLLCAMSLGLRSQNVVIIGKHPSKVAIAEKAGIEGVILRDVTASMNGRFDVVVEASGSESGFATATDLVRPRGKIVLKSTFHGTPVWQASRVVVDEITIVGSRCGRFAPAVELLAQNAVDVMSLIDDEMPLGRGVEAMAATTEKGSLKILLKP